jgi:chromate transport protein ChrA
VVGLTGGFLGVLIMMILPSMFLISARRKFGINYIENPYKINLNSFILPSIIIIIGLAVIGLNFKIFYN